MVERAERVMDSGVYISRGQRKRLTKKTKFVNQKLLEKKFNEEEAALKKVKQEKVQAE